MLIRFTTREWAQRVPWFMLDAPLCDIVASLPAGKTLCDAHPQAFAAPAPVATVTAPSPAPSVFVTQPTATSSAVSGPALTFSLDVALPRVLSPTLPVPSRPSSLSPAGGSLALAASLSPMDLVSLGPPSAGSGPDVAPLASSLPAPSLSVGGTRPRRVGSSAPAVAIAGRIAPVRFPFLLLCCPLTSCFQCERCRDKKKGCIAAVADDPRGPCTLCVKTGVTCICGRGVVGEFFLRIALLGLTPLSSSHGASSLCSSCSSRAFDSSRPVLSCQASACRSIF